MPKTSNQKIRTLYVLEALRELTDDKHHLTVKQIIEYLNARGLSCERKSIYDDLEVLKLFGIDVLSERFGREVGYFIGSRNFEVAELKMLVDIIQSSKFITRKKSQELIAKLGRLCSSYERKGLEKQLYFANSVKNVNESIFYNVDYINTAILQDNSISFQYIDYFLKNSPVYRKNGKQYLVSPYALIWDDENYYLIAFDLEDNKIKHFRVDKMSGISILPDKRKGKELFCNIDVSNYAKKIFGMFSGEEQIISFLITNNLIKVFIDRFGSDLIFKRVDDGHVSLSIKLDESPQFYGWLAGLGNEVVITAPNSVREGFKNYLDKISSIY